jgi:3-deoxy-D-manno-octulosonic-acid transferase
MARFFYTLAAIALLPWAALHLLWRARKQPEYLRHWGERFGFFGAADSRDPTRPTIWLHAVSVGETRAAQPLLAALRERFPGHRILLTHMTPTGRATSEALFGDSVERIYLPYDTPWAMRGFLRHYRPRLGLIMETELWPNLIAACRRDGVPLLAGQRPPLGTLGAALCENSPADPRGAAGPYGPRRADGCRCRATGNSGRSARDGDR